MKNSRARVSCLTQKKLTVFQKYTQNTKGYESLRCISLKERLQTENTEKWKVYVILHITIFATG